MSVLPNTKYANTPFVSINPSGIDANAAFGNLVNVETAIADRQQRAALQAQQIAAEQQMQAEQLAAQAEQAEANRAAQQAAMESEQAFAAEQSELSRQFNKEENEKRWERDKEQRDLELKNSLEIKRIDSEVEAKILESKQAVAEGRTADVARINKEIRKLNAEKAKYDSVIAAISLTKTTLDSSVTTENVLDAMLGFTDMNEQLNTWAGSIAEVLGNLKSGSDAEQIEAILQAEGSSKNPLINVGAWLGRLTGQENYSTNKQKDDKRYNALKSRAREIRAANPGMSEEAAFNAAFNEVADEVDYGMANQELGLAMPPEVQSMLGLSEQEAADFNTVLFMAARGESVEKMKPFMDRMVGKTEEGEGAPSHQGKQAMGMLLYVLEDVIGNTEEAISTADDLADATGDEGAKAQAQEAKLGKNTKGAALENIKSTFYQLGIRPTALSKESFGPMAEAAVQAVSWRSGLKPHEIGELVRAVAKDELADAVDDYPAFKEFAVQQPEAFEKFVKLLKTDLLAKYQTDDYAGFKQFEGDLTGVDSERVRLVNELLALEDELAGVEDQPLEGVEYLDILDESYRDLNKRLGYD